MFARFTKGSSYHQRHTYPSPVSHLLSLLFIKERRSRRKDDRGRQKCKVGQLTYCVLALGVNGVEPMIVWVYPLHSDAVRLGTPLLLHGISCYVGG
ncbi:hypothetical protein BaRGS_00030621 [Batillaria attramentaria]|uniref:Uncharacterized protein n=1 Tax=Batillaria attramentaria TaxID=370345 RepID=A0ABD0JT01_9CAEN